MARQRLLEGGRPALGAKGARVGEPARVVVHEPRRDEDLLALVELPAADDDVARGLAAEEPHGRTQAQRLLERRRRGREARDVLGLGEAAAAVRRLGRDARGRLGRRREEPQREGQRHRRRLVAREQHRHDLVAHLLIGHAGAPLVARREQAREQIGAAARIRPGRRVGRRALLADDLDDDRVEIGARVVEPPTHGLVPRGRHEAAPRVDERLERAQRLFQRARDARRRVAQIGAEQRLGDDLHREARHVGLDVARLAVAERRDVGGAAPRRDLDVGADLLAVQRGRDQRALAAPEVALAREEAVAEHRAERARRPVFDEDALAIEQHGADGVGLREVDERRAGHGQARRAAWIVAREPLDEPERIAPEGRERQLSAQAARTIGAARGRGGGFAFVAHTRLRNSRSARLSSSPSSSKGST